MAGIQFITTNIDTIAEQGERMIKTNKIKCKKCGDVIESTSVHDFKWCSCMSVAVDGGHEYLRRCGCPGDWEELSEVMEEK